MSSTAANSCAAPVVGVEVTEIPATTGAGRWFRDVIALSKPRLSTLVMFTAGAGVWVAPGNFGWLRTWMMLLSTAGIVGAANALNSYLERDTDGMMHRTRDRPLPSGRLQPRTALILAPIVLAVAIPMLIVSANVLTAALGMLAFVIYVGIYTPLKRYSSWAMPIGAIPGAMPPLMGWTAVTGSVDPGGLALFGILFFWQLPHFIAISIYLKRDYMRADLKVFAAVFGDRVAKIAILVTTLMLIPSSLALVPLGITAPLYAVVASLLGIGLLAWSITGLRKVAGAPWARGIFLGTLGYLTLLMAALVVAT